MALKLYLFGLITTLLLSFFLWILLIFTISPFQAPTWIILLFYVTFFIMLSALFSLINYYYKVWATNREVIFSHLGPSLRQAALLSLIATSCLFFEQIKVLNWWIAGMLLVAASLIELYFRSSRPKNKIKI